MRIDPAEIGLPDLYQWMISTITPRPIAWVSSVSAAGLTNLAPFSFFQGVTANPPTLLFSVANNRHGEKKDTIRNIEEVPEFVVNLVSYDLREAMNRSSGELPYGESEFGVAGVTPIPSEKVRPPRVAESSVSFECKLHQIVRVGEGPLAGNVIFGTILLLHVNERVLDVSGRKVDPASSTPSVAWARNSTPAQPIDSLSSARECRRFALRSASRRGESVSRAGDPNPRASQR